MANIITYPDLTKIVRIEHFPDQLDFLQQDINSLLGKIFYKNLIFERTPKGELAFISLTLVGRKELKINLFGTGVEVILFPSSTQDQSGPATEIDLELNYQWDVLRFIYDFRADEFGYTPRAFFDLFLTITGQTEESFLETIIEIVISEEEPLEAFINTVNDLAANSSSLNITLPQSITDIPSLIQEIITQGEEVFQVTYLFLEQLYPPSEMLDRLFELFQLWIKDITLSDLEELLIPQFSATIKNLSLAIAFPRKLFKPIYTGPSDYPSVIGLNIGEVLPEPYDSRISFDMGAMGYSTVGGIKFSNEQNLKFNKSQIGNTALTIELSDIKLDLSKEKNIPEINTFELSDEFQGVYVEEAIIELPEKWFKKDDVNTTNQGLTLGVYGRNVLIGQGKFWGKFGLEVVGSPNLPVPAGKKLFFHLGKKNYNSTTDERKGFAIGFEQFEIEFKESQIISSSVKGALRIPGFDNLTGGDPDIDIEAFFEQDGDFSITASNSNGVELKFRDVFSFTIKSLTVGKDDNRVFLSTTGSIQFLGLLGDFLKDPIELKKFTIFSDGSFELEGGAIPLPDSARIKIGPTEIAITAIHFGAHTEVRNGQERKYKYFGFDGGIDMNPGGVDARGDGIKYYFTVDDGPFHSYLKVESLSVDLVIPGTASREDAVLILKGYLALKDPEYEGSVEFLAPKVKIAGGASMKWNTQKPSFLVDARLELPTALPLGSTGLGIFGFRGLFGLRYVANREAPESWTDWYRESPRGVHVKKLEDPGSSATDPFSIGAGASMATMPDDGKVISLQLFLLLSIPNLILLEGRANVLGKRVGLVDGDPPFYAMVGFSPGESIEMGFGADYYLPQEGSNRGKLLRLQADVRAAYFFKDSRAWFLNFGTKNKPITAEIFSLFNGYTYLMLSASGIEAGAGVNIGFDKRYAGGMVRASAKAYLDVWGKISFERPQIGGGIAVGGSVSAYLLGIGFYLGIDTLLTAEAPKPLKVHGKVSLCIGVKLIIKKVEKCFTVKFTWEKEKNIDLTPIKPLPASSNTGAKPKPVQGIHIISGKTYDVNYLGERSAMPSPGEINKIIPLDTYVELQFEKPLIANDVSEKIGGVTNAPAGYEDLIPPKKGDRQVSHRYRIKNINLYINNNGWKKYHPYKALAESTQSPNVEKYKLGFWQKTGREYNKIRLLAQTPFSYTQAGQAAWYVPEQMGLTGGTLFCPNTERKASCVNFGGRVDIPLAGKLYPYKELALRITPKTGRFLTSSLNIKPATKLELFFPEAVKEVSLEYFSASTHTKVSCYSEKRNTEGILTGYQLISSKTIPRTLSRKQLEFKPAELSNSSIHKMTFEPSGPNHQLIRELELEIESLLRERYETKDINKGRLLELNQKILIKKGSLEFERTLGCSQKISLSPEIRAFLAYLNGQLKDCQAVLKKLQADFRKNCLRRDDDHVLKLELPEVFNPGGDIPQIQIRTDPELIKDFGDQSKKQEPLKSVPKRSSKTIKKEVKKTDKAATPKSGRIKDYCTQLLEEIRSKSVQCKNLEATIKEIEFILNSRSEDTCGLYLNSICLLTERDYIHNSLIPGQDAIEEDFQHMKDAINKTIAPIWRPFGKYLVELELTDTVNNQVKGPWKFYYGFSTSGPLGYFPEENIQRQNMSTQEEPILEHPLNQNANLGIEAPENMLKYYLDYDKCYPNADGRILYAKPLYYFNPELMIFFKEAFAYHFFQNWPAYQGLRELQYKLDIRIKDPVEDIHGQEPHTSQVIERTPAASYFFKEEENDDDNPANDISILNNLIPEGCWTTGVELLKPKRKYVTVTAKYLQPLKMYTAIILNSGQNNNREVHRYSFQTSRYRDFEEHIMSYRMKDTKFPDEQKDAVFSVEVNLAPAKVNDALKIVRGQNTGDQLLEATYADPFDRLIEGLLALGATNPPICTEFNLIKNRTSSTDKEVIALWIRTPEPFNDPKIPHDVLKDTVKLFNNGSMLSGLSILFSRDASQIFIMPESKKFTVSKIKVRFQYLKWDGWSYQQKAEQFTEEITI